MFRLLLTAKCRREEKQGRLEKVTHEFKIHKTQNGLFLDKTIKKSLKANQKEHLPAHNDSSKPSSKVCLKHTS